MKIFGTIYPFVETDTANLKIGRYVANYEFIKNLLREAEFDQFHLFWQAATRRMVRRAMFSGLQKEYCS